MKKQNKPGEWMGRGKPKLKVVEDDKPAPQAEAPKRAQMKITAETIARLKGGGRRPAQFVNPFVLPEMPPVFPGDRGGKPTKPKMAMDDFSGFSWAATWAEAQGGFLGAFSEGITFMGYPYLAYLAQIPEYRNISETIATECTRKWIKFQAEGLDAEKEDDDEQDEDTDSAEDRALVPTDPDADPDPDAEVDPQVEAETPAEPEDKKSDKTDKIKELEEAFERLCVRDIFKQMALMDGFFGRAHLYIDTGDGDTPEELQMDLGDGRNDLSKSKISPKRPVVRLQAVEPVWCYPSNYNANDPLKPDWYKPKSWFTMAKDVHASRLLTFVGRPVPDLMKPAFAFGGLSLTQMAKPTVDNWIRTRASVGDIINAFSVFVLATNLAETLQMGGNFLFDRAEMFNSTRDNRGLLITDKETEDFMNIAAPLGTLDALQAQSQEHMASVSRIPVVKLTGIQPAGLNADSEGVIRVFYDTIGAYQESFFRPCLTTIFWMVQLSLWGEIDEDITFEFEPLYSLTHEEQAEMRKKDAETGQILVDTGVISPEEERERIASDPNTPYASIDPEDVPELLQEEVMGLEPGNKRTGIAGGGLIQGPQGGAGEGGGDVAMDAEKPRIRRDAFLYMDGTSDKFAQCGTCWLYNGREKRCGILGPFVEVQATDSCDYYGQGEPNQTQIVKRFSLEEVGFVSRPVRCENCRYFEAKDSQCGLYLKLNKTMADEYDLDPNVMPTGCCNANMEMD